jgi:hypothetical protein
MDPAALAETHRRAQVELTSPVQRLLAEVYTRAFDPARPDETFPVYLAAAERVLGLGRANSAELARKYYAAAAANMGEKALDLGGAPKLDRDRLSASLSATGPATVFKALGEGVPYAEAKRRGLAATIAAGKRIMLDGGREMLVVAARRDPNVRGWARVTDGSSCHFCAMLVSRGPVYGEHSVGFRSHDRCGCGVRLVFKGETDGGWTPQARALRRLWDGVDEDGNELPGRTKGGTLTINEWRAILKGARKDPAVARSHMPPTGIDAVETAAKVGAAVAADTAWTAAFAEVRAKMDGDLATLGKVEVAMTDVEATLKAQQDALRALLKEHGFAGANDLFEARDQVFLIRQKTQALEELAQIHDDYPGALKVRKWPEGLKEKARLLGIERRQYGTGLKMAKASVPSARETLANAERRLALVEEQMPARLEAAKVAGAKPTFVDDLNPDGTLGARTAGALDTVLEAGRLVDDEMQRRLAPRLAPIKAAVDEYEAAGLAIARANREVWDLDVHDPDYREKMRALDRRIDEASATKQRLDAVYRTAKADMLAATREVYAEVLGEVRELGKGARPEYTGRHTVAARNAMAWAHSVYPSEWNDHIAGKIGKIALGENKRGYFAGNKIMLSPDSSQPGGKFDHVAVHELGHGMEATVPGLRAMEWAYHFRRSEKVTVGGVEKLAPPFDIYGRNIGMGSELAHPDKWNLTYTGKTYRKGASLGADSYWEVFTTGVESLTAGSPYFGEHADRPGDDVEFRQFILGVLSVL